MPKQTIDRINAVKGPYISRAKFILRAVDKALQEEEQEKLSDAHSSVSSPEERQAAPYVNAPVKGGNDSND